MSGRRILKSVISFFRSYVAIGVKQNYVLEWIQNEDFFNFRTYSHDVWRFSQRLAKSAQEKIRRDILGSRSPNYIFTLRFLLLDFHHILQMGRIFC